MEAVALASTFATLIGFAMQLYGNCKYYIDAARGDCPSDLKLILIETSSLRATLEAVRDILELSDTPEQDERRLKAQIARPIADCKQCIDELLKLVPKPMLNRATGEGGELRKRDKASIVIQALAWGTGGKKGRCDMLLQHLRAHKATLNLGLTTELSSDLKKVGAEVKEVKATVNTMQAKLDRKPPSLFPPGHPILTPHHRSPTRQNLQMARTNQPLLQPQPRLCPAHPGHRRLASLHPRMEHLALLHPYPADQTPPLDPRHPRRGQNRPRLQHDQRHPALPLCPPPPGGRPHRPGVLLLLPRALAGRDSAVPDVDPQPAVSRGGVYSRAARGGV